MRQDVYSGRLKLNGEEHVETLRAANNYASILIDLERFEESKVPLCKRFLWPDVLGESQEVTLQGALDIRVLALYKDTDAYARRSPRGREYARGH